MFNSTSVGISHTTGSIDNLSEQQSKSSVKANTGQIQHLTSAGRSRSSQRRAESMQAQIDDAAHQPSTSKNPRYNALLVLKTRDYQNAPGSGISLTAGGIAGGTPQEAKAWIRSLPSEERVLLNQYKTNASRLNEQDRERGQHLNREYNQRYFASSKQYRGDTSQEGDTSSSRPTTGQLRLKENDMRRYYGYRQSDD